MQLKTIRLNDAVPNLFWISEGRAYYTLLNSEQAARVVRFLEESLPVSEGNFAGFGDVSGISVPVEECFLVEADSVVSVRQVGSTVVGNVRLWSKRVREFLNL
ncbi:hypothetical protein IT411_00265 [Candidatus Peregrinibacteria bacterium]|nr:hypothetical protein [Candidatus Peregrinibacteria bacterium]